MGRGRALAKCHIALAGQYRDYPYTKNTTHVVATEKAWKRKDKAVARALKLNDEDGLEIKIVSFDWLEDSVNNKSKKREGPYLWAKLEPSIRKQEAARKREEKAKEPKTGHVNMMAEVLQKGTEDYVTTQEAAEVDKKIEEERRVRQAMEEAGKKSKEEERKKNAEIFRNGAKKARNELFTDNHHIYADDTNFKYDIVLIKIDKRNNRNERYALTIYESNAEPHTYAMNCQFAGTSLKPSNNVLVTLGSPFPPAFHAFKACFKEKTGGEWDDRIITAVERAKKQKRERGEATGSDDQGSRKGVAVGSQDGKEKTGEDFEKMPFQYDPPRFGSRGRLFTDKIPGGLVAASNEDVHKWMSGANGTGPDNSIDLTDDEPVASKTAVEPDGDVDQSEPLSDEDHFQQNESSAAPLQSTEKANAEFEKEMDDWLKNDLENNYPFDYTDSNLEFLAEMDSNFLDNSYGDSMLQYDPNTGEGFPIQGDPSFGQADTNIAEPPTSFEPPSTVPESFQTGTQDVTETQLAERAQGELEEFLNLPSAIESVGGAPVEQSETQPSSFNLGSLALGKRKTSPVELSFEHGSQRAKLSSDEEEAFAVAAEESFDADEAYRVWNQVTQGGDSDAVPRAIKGEDLGAPILDQAPAGGGENAVVTGEEGDAAMVDG